MQFFLFFSYLSAFCLFIYFCNYCYCFDSFLCCHIGQTVFDPMFISVYNLFYTSLPVLALGVFDQDVNDVNSLKYPKLFTPGHLNLLFNKAEFFKSAMHGCITSCVLFFIPYGERVSRRSGRRNRWPRCRPLLHLHLLTSGSVHVSSPDHFQCTTLKS